MWEIAFDTAQAFALLGWAALLLAPRKPFVLAAVLYLGVMLLCLAYSVGLIGIFTGLLDPVGGVTGSVDFTSIEGVRSLFASDGGVTIGWIHYLAFDLFVGLWIARDADAKGFSRWVQAPILLLTLFAGPLGLLIWLAVRERRARASGRWQ